jgi:mRNA interferase HigB
VRVIGLKSVEIFCDRHFDARPQIEAWLCEAREAQWQSSQDIRERYTNADFLSESNAVFNLKGSNYKLEVKVHYINQIVLIVDIRTNDNGMELLWRA